MEDGGLFYGHLVYFTAIWHSGHQKFVIVIWYIFFPFWYVVQRKIWQP
jgi:hypothetical protein